MVDELVPCLRINVHFFAALPRRVPLKKCSKTTQYKSAQKQHSIKN